ncbi:MAG: hypothetical protein C0507_11770 [Cyanobacteria bacterium PR.3.49]|nr:hypothetical protein [Cyanobacteria bacterium PR.3.49]
MIKQIILAANPNVKVHNTAWDKQDIRKKSRDEMIGLDKFRLLEISYSPDGIFLDGPEVWLKSYPVPKDRWAELSKARELTIEAVETFIKSVSETKLWHAKWNIKILLDKRNSKLEIDSLLGANTPKEERVKRTVAVNQSF